MTVRRSVDETVAERTEPVREQVLDGEASCVDGADEDRGRSGPPIPRDDERRSQPHEEGLNGAEEKDKRRFEVQPAVQMVDSVDGEYHDQYQRGDLKRSLGSRRIVALHRS